MSRFGTDMDFIYQTNGSNWFVGTFVNLTAGQMPQYPLEEYRITDSITLRNMSGVACTYQNYSKAGYKFKWTYLDEAKVNELRTMFNLNPYMTIFSNSVNFGTFIMNGQPTINETQFELYDVTLDLQES